MAAAGRADPTPTPLARLANPIEFQVLPSRRAKARPAAALVPQRYVRPGVAATVIDEDTYVSALDHIIEREFFPDLPQLQQQLRWLETVDSGDAARIEQMRHELAAAVRRTDTFAKSPTPAEPWSATPLPAFAAGAAAAAARRGRMMEGLDLALGGSRPLFAMGSSTPLRRSTGDDVDDDGEGSAGGSGAAVSGRKRPRPADAASAASGDGADTDSADPWAAGVPNRPAPGAGAAADAAAAGDSGVVASRRKRRRLSQSAASAALSAAAGARRRSSGTGVGAADDVSVGDDDHDDGVDAEEDSSDPAAAAARRAARAAGSMSLGAFQATFTSEDNASFGRNQDQTLQAHRRKHWWLHERVDARKRRLMLVDGNASRAVGLLGPMTDDNLTMSGSKFIEDVAAMGGDTKGVLPTWTYRPMNSLFFPPDLASTSAVSGVARPTLHPHLRVAEGQAAEAHKLLTDTEAAGAAQTAQQQRLLSDAPAPALLTDGKAAPAASAPKSSALDALPVPGGALIAVDSAAPASSSSSTVAAVPVEPAAVLPVAEAANAAHRVIAPLGAAGNAAGRVATIAAAAAAARQQLIVRNSLPHPSLTDVVTVGSVDVFLPSGHRIRRSDGGIVAPPQLRTSRTRFNHEQVHAALRAPDAAAVATQAAVANAVLAAAVSAGTIVPPSPKINGYGFLATPLLESMPVLTVAAPAGAAGAADADAAVPSMSQRDAINAIRAASGLTVPAASVDGPSAASAGKATRSAASSTGGGQYKLLDDPRAAGSRSTIRASEVASIVDPMAMAAAEASAPAFQVNPAVHAEEVAARLLEEKRRKMKSTRTTEVAVAALKRAGYDASGSAGMVDAPRLPALSSSASAAGDNSVITRRRLSSGSGGSVAAGAAGAGEWPLAGTLPMGTPVVAAGTPAALSVAARQRAAAGSVLAGGIGASVAAKSQRSSATSASAHPAVRAVASLSPAARALALSVARKSASGSSPGAGGSPFGGGGML